MKGPVSRRRGKWPTLPTRTMDLLGVGEDGNLYVWSEAKQVQPLDRFALDAEGHILSGHYVIERNGKAITAHIGNSATPGWVVVQYMCGGLGQAVMPRKYVEPMLLGRLVPDPVQEARILDMLRQLSDDQVARQTAPHRKRGAA